MTQEVTFENQRHSFPDDFTEEEIREALNATPEKNLYNAPIDTLKRSGKQFAKDVITPFTQPVETAQSIWELGKSIKNLLFVEGKQENEKVAIAMGEFFKDRYGGIENIKKTFRTDPVGIAADLSIFLTAGATLPARVSGTTGKIAKVVGTAGKVIDPIGMSAKAVKWGVMKPLGHAIAGGLGWTTGSGTKAVKTAYGAGYAQGDKAKAFSEGRAGSVTRSEKVKTNLSNTLLDLKNKYRTRWENSDAGKNLKNIKFPAKDINNILKNLEIKNKRDGRWIDDADRVVFEKISSIKSNIWGSTKRRNGAGGDALVDEINKLLKNEPNNTLLLELKDNVKQRINSKMPEYINLTKGFDEISKAEQAIDKITSTGDADKILTNINNIFDKNTKNLVVRNAVSEIDKAKNMNLEEVAAGKSMSGYFPTSDNLVTQGIKMYGLYKTGGIASPIFSPQVVGRNMKSLGYAQKRAVAPLVDTLRAGRVATQQKDDEVFLNDTAFYGS